MYNVGPCTRYRPETSMPITRILSRRYPLQRNAELVKTVLTVQMPKKKDQDPQAYYRGSGNLSSNEFRLVHSEKLIIECKQIVNSPHTSRLKPVRLPCRPLSVEKAVKNKAQNSRSCRILRACTFSRSRDAQTLTPLRSGQRTQKEVTSRHTQSTSSPQS